MFAFISLLFDLSHADVDLVTREFRLQNFHVARNDFFHFEPFFARFQGVNRA